MSNLRRMKQRRKKEYEKKKQSQKFIFTFAFYATILVSVILFIICVVFKEAFIWARAALTVTWGLFTLFFLFCIKNKHWFLSEEYYHGMNFVNKTEAWKESLFYFFCSAMIFICSLIYLIVGLII